jgi:UDP-N-acetylglucosamine--N-acetylmuramyl-(pentapeptide) pyrophosphoryl-undecaprenol N-acetylglucosamine transferase
MKKKILFTGGGTAGHVYPAMAIIKRLNREEFEILWMGSSHGMEKSIVEAEGITYYSIPCGKLRRYFSLQNFFDIFRIIGGFFFALFYLIKIRPSLVFSKGGFVTVAPAAAASLLRIPVFTHDSDIGPGLATRINSFSADRILVSSEKSRNYFSKKMNKKVFVTGNPVRNDILLGDSKRGKEILGISNDIQVIIVMGGSLGAEQINKLILNNLDILCKKFFIVHQRGDKNYFPVKHSSYFSVPYFNDGLNHILASADLVISRAGASAVWEFASINLPSILIPLESGSRGEQVKNAEIFEEFGCSLVLRGDISSETFMDSINKIMDNRENLKKMKEAAVKIGNIDSALIIAEMIKEVI